jgi:transcriptional regulator with XRE-family HTH domain
MMVRFRLREAREQARLTQDELARRVGVRQATISNLESGKSTRISFALLGALCRELRVDPSTLFGSANFKYKGESPLAKRNP